MALLILYFTFALIVSFVCSLLEAIILSCSHSYVEKLVREEHWSGRRLQRLKDKVDRPLAAILSVNTVANTVGAAGVGAQALRVAEHYWPNQSHNWVVAIASAILTLSILVFSEIIPKTIGAVYWRHLAPIAAYVVQGLIVMVYPVVIASEKLARLISRNAEGGRVSREEMMASAEIGAIEGELTPHEIRIIRNLLCLNRVRAKDVLTPRHVLLAFQQDITVGQVVQQHSPLRFSRLPIFNKDLDDITGFVLRYQILGAYSRGEVTTSLKNLAQPLFAVPETKSVGSILEEFVRRGEQIFLAIDEYGGTAGLITLEDAIETLLGVEIVDELDSVTDMRKLAAQLGAKRVKALEQRNHPTPPQDHN